MATLTWKKKIENYEAEIVVHGKEVKFSLWDTAGQEGYARIRTLSYPKTDIFLLCFSVDNHPSLVNVKDRWHKEIQQHCPTAPIILVGTKIDLRDDQKTIDDLAKQDKAPITEEMGAAMAEDIGAIKYLECSALTRKGLKGVFDEALQSVISSSGGKPISGGGGGNKGPSDGGGGCCTIL
jgi:small GTP-binding protein